MDVITFTSVTKTFSLNAQRMPARGDVERWFKSRGIERFFALKNISFSIMDGRAADVLAAYEGKARVGLGGQWMGETLQVFRPEASPGMRHV
jgi:hypothetical protein